VSPAPRQPVSHPAASAGRWANATGADQPVSIAELLALWDELRGRGEMWNGMTGHYLRQRYGHRVYRKTGAQAGWYVRPEVQQDA
jgi:hypothetical protein